MEFSEAEQRLYLRVHKEAKAEFEKYTAQGINWVVRNLLSIMALLSPLRAICSGGVLRERVLPQVNNCINNSAPIAFLKSQYDGSCSEVVGNFGMLCAGCQGAQHGRSTRAGGTSWGRPKPGGTLGGVLHLPEC